MWSTSFSCVPVCIYRTSSLLLSASRDCTARLWDARCKMPLLHVFQVPCPCALLLLPWPFLPHSLRLTASLPLFPSAQRSDHTSMVGRTGAFKHCDVGALFARRHLCLDRKRRLLCQGPASPTPSLPRLLTPLAHPLACIEALDRVYTFGNCVTLACIQAHLPQCK
jgi:hypothetical protein